MLPALLMCLLWATNVKAADPVPANVPLVRGTWLTPELSAFLLDADSVAVSCLKQVQTGEERITVAVPGGPLADTVIVLFRSWLRTPGAVRGSEHPPGEDAVSWPALGMSWWRQNEYVSFLLYPTTRRISYACTPDKRGRFVASGYFDVIPSAVETEVEALAEWAISLSEDSPN